MCALKVSHTSVNEQFFYGHGKLLLSGEYFVLDGAKALAVPTRFGQSLRIKPLHSAENILYWVALNNKGKTWLNLVIDTSDFSFTTISSAAGAEGAAQRLSSILKTARELNSEFLTDARDLAVETKLEFPNEWGLGSSSTLIHCISKWANVDGYTLLQKTLGGSGYDVACAGFDVPILYQLVSGTPVVEPVHWQPPFSSQIYFAYTGNKQLSSEAIKHYRNKTGDKSHVIAQLDNITNLMLRAVALDEFEELMRGHEIIIGAELKQMKVADTIFADYWGAVKSLGAWGGDYVMLSNNRSSEELGAYLKEKNISIVFNWKDLILSDNTIQHEGN